MSHDYEVDTDVLRAMASKARGITTDLGPTEIAAPSDSGHDWVAAAAVGFSYAWTRGLKDRVADTEDFADRLDTTARVFDDGTNAAKSEADLLIWDF